MRRGPTGIWHGFIAGYFAGAILWGGPTVLRVAAFVVSLTVALAWNWEARHA